MPAGPVDPDQPDAAHLRARADELMRIVRAIDAANLRRAAALAGPQTWIGSGPEQCAAELRTWGHTLSDIAGDLRRRAAAAQQAALEALAISLTHPALSCGKAS
jgi:hypothetical protein